MATLPVRDPADDHLLKPQNAALVVIDYQPSQVQAVASMDHDLLVDSIVSVAPSQRPHAAISPSILERRVELANFAGAEQPVPVECAHSTKATVPLPPQSLRSSRPRG